MRERASTDDPAILALGALGWILADQTRADRLLALTGLSPEDLRARADDAGVLGAVLAFLEAHEPDLVACAAALDCKPEWLVRARMLLEA
jgi:hypothetical protein